jgi:iron uptake system component EfeO
MAFGLTNWRGKTAALALAILAGSLPGTFAMDKPALADALLLAGAGDQVANPTPPPLDEERVAEIDKAAAAFKPIAMADVDSIVAGVERLDQAVQAGDLAAAQRAWVEARVGWERSEIFSATLVPDLDKAIDTWPDARSGFHAIEFRLFATNQMPVAETRQLLDNVRIFQHVIQQQAFTGRILMVGVATLAYEVGESKSKGGESEISGTSLADIQHNVEAIDRAWHAIFAPSIATKDPKLAKRIEAEITELKKIVFVPSLLDIDPPALEGKAETLAGSIADANFKLGWYPLDFTGGD